MLEENRNSFLDGRNMIGDLIDHSSAIILRYVSSPAFASDLEGSNSMDSLRKKDKEDYVKLRDLLCDLKASPSMVLEVLITKGISHRDPERYHAFAKKAHGDQQFEANIFECLKDRFMRVQQSGKSLTLLKYACADPSGFQLSGPWFEVTLYHDILS